MSFKKTCCICGKEFLGFGMDPRPVKPGIDNRGYMAFCCDGCYEKKVIPARNIEKKKEKIPC